MKVTVTHRGKFGGFYVVPHLLKRGYLQRFITNYPKFEVKKYGIPRDNVKSILVQEVIERGWRKLPAPLRSVYNPLYLVHEVFDRLACRHLQPSDIIVGNAAFFLHSLRRAKEMGALTIVERGSTHILYQMEILREEYERYDLKPQLADPRTVEKQFQEYEEADYIAVQ